MKHQKLPFILFVLSSLGCSVGEDYVRPALDLPPHWANSETNSVSEVDAEPTISVWWKTLGDPLLDELIAEALRENLTREQALARIKRARADRQQAASVWWPQISLEGSYRRAGQGSRSASDGKDFNDSSSFSTSESSGGRDTFIAGFDSAWELDIFGKTRRDVEASEAGIEFAVTDEMSVQTSLTAEVGSHYATLRGLQRRRDVAEQNLELQRQSASISQRRFGAGFASALDTAQANAEVALTLAQIPQLEGQIRVEMHTLATLLGQLPAALYSKLEPTQTLPALPKDLPLGFPATLLDRRPDVLRAEANLHRAIAETGSAQADQYPQFSLSALLSLEGNRFDALGFWENHIWNFGTSIFYPLIDGGRIRANIAARSAEAEEALAAYEQTLLIALQEVENALVNFKKEQERERFLSTAVEENRRALNAARTLYIGGVAEFLNVVSAERALFSSEDALTQSRTTQIVTYIALYKSLGGGWQPLENAP